MPKTLISYIELPTGDVEASKNFYGPLFGWSFEDFGPSYAAFSEAGLEGGFNGNNEADRTAAPLVVLLTDNLEAMVPRIQAAGGTITLPIFPFPGGRRFHFTDPAGNELAMMQAS